MIASEAMSIHAEPASFVSFEDQNTWELFASNSESPGIGHSLLFCN